MSQATSLLRKPGLRIVAFPLARTTKGHPPRISRVDNTNEEKQWKTTDFSLPETMIYYHFNLISQKGKGTERGGAIQRGMSWALSKATDTWSSFGKAEEGTWKVKLYQWGERLVDRIDFEELALKGVDPSLGPSVMHPDLSGDGVKEKAKEMHAIPLLHPASQISASACLLQLQHLLEHRTPRHRRGFWMWLCISPFTAPFMIIPIIPNIPFFFCAWRAWSHYRAYRASQYLEECMKQGLIIPETDARLDRVYEGAGDGETGMLLNRGLALEAATVMEISAADMLRAVTQARSRLSATALP